MNNQELQLKNKIMRRVRFVFFAKKVIRPVAFELAFIVALLCLETFLVSIRHVITNASGMHDIIGLSNFFIVAFMKTEWTVKALFLGMVFVAIAFLRDVYKGLAYMTLNKVKLSN
jgi:hypothetical protein